jgi:predicted MFS family arabinose efflux permease
MNAVGPAMMEHIADRAGWPWGFAAASAAALCGGILSRWVRDCTAGARRRAVPGLWEVVRDPAQLRIAIVVTLAGIAFGAMITFHQPFALSLGATHVRSFFVAYAAAAVVVRVGFGRLIDRDGWRRVSLASLALYGCVVTAMARLAGLGAGCLALFGGGLGVAHGLFYPSLNALAVAGRGRDERGKVMAIFQAAFTIGFAGGSYPLGILAERMGYPAVFVAAGLCAFAGLAVLLLARERGAARRALRA